MSAVQKRFLSLLAERRNRWVLSRWGILVVVALSLALLFTFLRELYPFLSLSERIDSEILVIDGGMPVHLLPSAAAEFRTHPYREVWVVHGIYLPVVPKDNSDSEDYIVQILARHGIPMASMHLVAFSSFQKDRISSSAAELKVWCSKNGTNPKAFNVVAAGSEARRTLVLYRQVWGDSSRVGVIPLDDPAFDGRHWWRSSEGMRQVFFEAIALFCVLLFFWPSV